MVREISLFIYSRLSYWLILTLLLVWVWQVAGYLRARHFSLARFWQRHRIPLIAAAAVTALDVGSIQPTFRVLSDETNLLGVSQSMFNYKTAFNSTQQKRFYGAMQPISFEVEKRPLVFPFLVNLVHVARGYSPENPFVVNAAVLFVLLAVVGVAVGSMAGTAGAVASILLVGSYPLVAMTARSAGFDLLATLFTALSFVFLYQHIKEPSGTSLAALTATALVFTQVRYESGIYVGVLYAGLVVLKYVRFRFIAENVYFYAASLLLLVPLVAQRILLPSPYENGVATMAFSVDNFRKYIIKLWDSLWAFDFWLPHEPILYWLAVPGGYCLLKIFTDRTVDLWKREWLAIVVLALGAVHVVLFSYYFGDFTHPASARFFLNLSIGAALVPAVLHRQWPLLITQWRLLAFSFVVFIIYHPISSHSRFTATQILWRESEMEWRFLAQRRDRNVLVITSRPGQVTVMEYGAVNFDYARSNAASLLLELRRHLYSEILVFQRISYSTGSPVPDDQPGPAFRLQPLQELQSSADEFIRISRVFP